jgi:hypothetical protein
MRLVQLFIILSVLVLTSSDMAWSKEISYFETPTPTPTAATALNGPDNAFSRNHYANPKPTSRILNSIPNPLRHGLSTSPRQLLSALIDAGASLGLLKVSMTWNF